MNNGFFQLATELLIAFALVEGPLVGAAGRSCLQNTLFKYYFNFIS